MFNQYLPHINLISQDQKAVTFESMQSNSLIKAMKNKQCHIVRKIELFCAT